MRIEGQLSTIADRLHVIAASARPLETGGVLSASLDIVQLTNRAEHPERDFDLGPLSEIKRSEGEPLAIWHTHPDDEVPSPMDIAGCRATALPWIVAGPSKLWVLHPSRLPYEGRDFLYGSEDCWQLVSDWHAQEHGIFLPWFRRPADGWWEEAGDSPFVTAARDYDFALVPADIFAIENLRVGDVLLMQMAARRVNHTAVYVGGGHILHHIYDQLSLIEQLDSRYQRMIHWIARHNALQ